MQFKFYRISLLLLLSINFQIAYSILNSNVTAHIFDFFKEVIRYYSQPDPISQLVFPSGGDQKNHNSRQQQEYDYIIVGAGPAGCVLANRLTENPNLSVLLIEAGTIENDFHKVPILAPFLQGTSYNWNYVSEPKKGVCLGMNRNRCAQPRGKGLGGSSLINYMIYNRGNRHDFNRWSETGNIGWSYEEILPYFLKSERANLTGIEKILNSRFHNKKGLLSVENVPYRSKLSKVYIEACQQLGFNVVDYNGETQMGVSYFQANTQNGKRHSAATAFIEPILGKRKNLTILLNSRVLRVLLNNKTKTAYGVEYLYSKQKFTVFASHEVILSAGTFNSPQILMLSGIGPKTELEKLKIPLIENLPVGKILYDHMGHLGPTFVLNTTGGDTLDVAGVGLSDFVQYFRGQGVLTMIGGVEALTFIKAPNSNLPPDYPDIEIIFGPGSMASDEGAAVKRGANFRDDIYNTVYRPLEHRPEDLFTTVIMPFHPKSKGYLRLRDRNPLSSPLIYPEYFSEEDDIETLLFGIKSAIQISRTPAFQKFGARLHDIPLPGCKHLSFGSDDYWRCSIRTLSYTLHHQVGTCKMGASSDPTAVVSPELKVLGVRGLRVVDTSVIPLPLTGHTNAVSYMIGEKAADMIKNSISSM